MIKTLWPTATVASLVEQGFLLLNDGYRMRRAELGSHGIPFVRGGDIGESGEIDTAVADHILPHFRDQLWPKLTKPGDVAFITKGTVGRVGRLRDSQPEVVFAPQICWWRSLDHAQLSPTFLYFLLRSRWFQANLDAVKTSGSMVADYVSLRDQQSFVLPVPPIESQRRIAAVLGGLDDRIEVNRRMNETLEGMARALFKSWFVDFDPVRAKMEGRAPHGMDADTAALFPDSFQDSELGPIPKGWSVTSVSSYADLNPEVWRKSTAPAEVSYLDLANVKWGEVGEAAVLPFSAAPSRARRVLREGDTIIGTVRPGNGSFGYIETPQAGLTGSTGFAVLRPVDQAWREFVYLLLTKRDYIEYLAVVADGSAYPAVDPSIVAHTLFVAPPQPVLTRFSEMASRLLSLSGVNRRRSRTLAQLRDTLLPKLLSGELRVPEAEEIAKSA